jgi:hypothetical protein
MPQTSRFDYVKYDELATITQKHFKNVFEDAEQYIDRLANGRAKSLALTSLEESYMWVGKAIRDEQIARNGSAELQEGRNDE